MSYGVDTADGTPLASFSGANVTVTKPNTVRAGNAGFVALLFRVNTLPTITPPAGWQLVLSKAGTNCGCAAYVKPSLTGSETDFGSWGFSPSVPSSPINGGVYHASQLSGFGAAISVDKANNNSGQSTSPSTGSITPVVNPSLLLACLSQDNAANDAFSSFSGGMTQLTAGGNVVTLYLAISDTSAHSESASLPTGTDHWAGAIANIYSPGPTKFRKTFSQLGTRTGGRQLQGWGS